MPLDCVATVLMTPMSILPWLNHNSYWLSHHVSHSLLAKPWIFTVVCSPFSRKKHKTWQNHAKSQFVMVKTPHFSILFPVICCFSHPFCPVSQDLCALEKLLQSPRHPRAPDEEGYTAVHEAAECGHLEALQLLLEARAEVDGSSSGLSGWWYGTMEFYDFPPASTKYHIK